MVKSETLKHTKMSNLSNIGFFVSTEEEFYKLVEQVYPLGKFIKASQGTYNCYSENSGAELWMQLNENKELIGINPHFQGKSRVKVSLTSEIERTESLLDGALHAWANPSEDGEPESGYFPFVFDLPNLRTTSNLTFPQITEVQLTAFAHEISVFKSEQAFDEHQNDESFKWASQSFTPTGLFNFGEENNESPAEATALFTGLIKACEKRKNTLTGQKYFWMLVDTLGMQIDVVADVRFFEQAPQVDGVIQGQFWISGKLLPIPERVADN